MTRTAAPGVFRSLNTKALRRHGLQGDEVLVRLEGDQLLLAGSDGGSLSISAGSVDRLRHFGTEEVQEAPSNIPATTEVTIWWAGRREPVTLTPFARRKAYRSVIGGFAERVAAWRGVDRLRIGPGYATAIINLLIVLPPCLLLLAVLIGVSIMDGGWWWLATILLSALFLWLGGRNIVSRWPRRVASVEAFKANLP